MRPPEGSQEGTRLLRRAVTPGVRLIDTAEFCGPGVSERLIAEALHPYPDGLVIANLAASALGLADDEFQRLGSM
jgi:aryl-alcohol dehydrogenase-like predicted oxidoreductase